MKKNLIIAIFLAVTSQFVIASGDDLQAVKDLFDININLVDTSIYGVASGISQVNSDQGRAFIDQSNGSNLAIIVQAGTGNNATITQDGDGNRARLVQIGDDISGVITQIGDGNVMDIYREGDNFNFNGYQNGGSNTFIYHSIQAGGALQQLGVSQVGSNAVAAIQMRN